MLGRATQGDPRVWRVVRVPSEADEAARQLSRELDAVTHDRTQVLNRMHGLLTTEGVHLALTGDVPGDVPGRCPHCAGGTGTPPAGGTARATRARLGGRVEALTARRAALQAQRRRDVTTGTTPAAHAQMRQLAQLSAVGMATATVLVREFFGWRAFRNRRQVGGCAGLTATPFQTGGTHHEQGISKAGNRRVRTVMIELAWGWPAVSAAERAECVVPGVRGDGRGRGTGGWGLWRSPGKTVDRVVALSRDRHRAGRRPTESLNAGGGGPTAGDDDCDTQGTGSRARSG
jgi:transposase